LEILLMLPLAILIDTAFGEPPDKFHPVAWIGKVIGFFERLGHNRNHAFQLVYGAFMTLFIIALLTVPAYFLMSYLNDLSMIAYTIVGAVLLKLTFCLRGLRQAAHDMKQLLVSDKLDESRLELKVLASRDASKLPKDKVVSGVVESLAESSCDSLIAPIFYFLIFGVPGAIAYRVANTFDSMMGYHGEYEYLGKFAARLDDVLNYIPARLTAFFIITAAYLSRYNGRKALKTALRDHNKTESPNAGWPMSAAAGALGVQFEKVDHYKLGDPDKPLVPETIDSSLRLMNNTFGNWVLVCMITGVILIVI